MTLRQTSRFFIISFVFIFQNKLEIYFDDITSWNDSFKNLKILISPCRIKHISNRLILEMKNQFTYSKDGFSQFKSNLFEMIWYYRLYNDMYVDRSGPDFFKSFFKLSTDPQLAKLFSNWASDRFIQ